MITKLTITPCDLDDKGNVTGPRTGEAFTVRLNPSNYTRNFEITYNTTKAMGAPVMQPRFNGAGEKKMEFDIVMDGTGVVPPTSPNSTAIDVDSQLADLRDVVYTLVGTEHEPNTVMLVWGSFKFVGKLSTMLQSFCACAVLSQLDAFALVPPREPLSGLVHRNADL